MKCIECGKLIPEIRSKYCSDKCKKATYKKLDHERYLRQRKKFIARAEKWRKENPERAKELNKKACDKFRTEKRERYNELMRKAARKYQQTPKGRVKCRKNNRLYYYRHRKKILEKLREKRKRKKK